MSRVDFGCLKKPYFQFEKGCARVLINHTFCISHFISYVNLQGEDLVPEPRIIIAALKACRRLNDYSLAVRYLEAVQVKIL